MHAYAAWSKTTSRPTGDSSATPHWLTDATPRISEFSVHPGSHPIVALTIADLQRTTTTQHHSRTMSLLRPSLRLARTPALRTLSTSAPVRERFSTDHVPPADVVAGRAPGPVTVHETAREVEVDVVSDAPAELRHRQVRIFKPSKNTMQSAKGKTKVWRIDWDVLQGAGRWENPLMGWASSADYMQGTTLAFRTREDAVRFVSCAEGRKVVVEADGRLRGKVGSTLCRSQRHHVSLPRTTRTTTSSSEASCVSATQSRWKT